MFRIYHRASKLKENLLSPFKTQQTDQKYIPQKIYKPPEV